MYRKMFSSTTIASSMTMPVASDRASIVMLFSVKPSAFITVNVPMIDVGNGQGGDERDPRSSG